MSCISSAVEMAGFSIRAITRRSALQGLWGGNVGGHAHGKCRKSPFSSSWGSQGGQNDGLLLGTIECCLQNRRFPTQYPAAESRWRGPADDIRCIAWPPAGSLSMEPKLPWPLDQRRPHGKVLGHAHQGIVNGGCRRGGVILTEHFPHHPGTLPEGPVGGSTQVRCMA